MKSKYLISVKSSGLCFNIMRLIILTDLAKKYNRKLLFLTKSEHINILKKFNNKCKFIPYVDNHTKLFNNFTRKKSLHTVYDLKYIKFLKDTYLNKIFDSIRLNNCNFISGSAYEIEDSDKEFLIIDYNDGMNDSKILNTLSIDKIQIKKEQYNSVIDSNILTVNVKINNPNNNRIYELWDELIPTLKSFNKPILLISGNNDIKEYIGKKHNCKYIKTETETNFSNIRGNDITRGKALDIFTDLITCSFTHFIPFIYFRENHQDILDKYSDINFVYEKEEKFDILAEYMKNYFNLS